MSFSGAPLVRMPLYRLTGSGTRHAADPRAVRASGTSRRFGFDIPERAQIAMHHRTMSPPTQQPLGRVDRAGTRRPPRLDHRRRRGHPRRPELRPPWPRSPPAGRNPRSQPTFTPTATDGRWPSASTRVFNVAHHQPTLRGRHATTRRRLLLLAGPAAKTVTDGVTQTSPRPIGAGLYLNQSNGHLYVYVDETVGNTATDTAGVVVHRHDPAGERDRAADVLRLHRPLRRR